MRSGEGYRANLDRRAVSRAIEAWRREADDMTVTALAAAAGWSIAKMSFLLNAVTAISEADLLTLALILKATPADRELAHSTLLRAKRPEAWDGRPCLGWGLDELEAEAHELRIVAGELLPPLLRTQVYAGAVRAAQAMVLSEHRRPYSHQLREQTLGHLLDAVPLRVQVVVSEAALQQVVGSPKITADQLLWLLQLMGLPSVTVQVVPYTLGAVPGPGFSFSCMSFLERQFDDVVAVELLHETRWLEAEEEREPYEHTFLKLQDVALSEVESVDFISERLSRAQKSS